MIFDARRRLAGLLAGCALLAGPAYAEDESVWVSAVADADTAQAGAGEDQPERADAPDGKTPEEGSRRRRMKAFSEVVDNVIVTTRKRQEAIQDTPVSITAFNDLSLRQLNVRRIQDIAPVVPNLDYQSTVGLRSARANSRGVGQSDPIGSIDPGVGLYVDGVYFARAQASLPAAIDLERVEVIRGPQGTIFGKNTIGGAVNIITREPDWAFGGEAEVRAGNFDMFETRASLNVPIVDEVMAARLSFATATRDGFEKERLGGTDPNDEKLLAGRAQLRWLLGENLELMLAADRSREKQVQSQGKCSVVNGGRNLLAALNMFVGYTQAWADVAASDNPRRVETDLSGLRDELHTYGGSARLMWEIFPDTTLRSITALRGLENEQVFDFDGTRIQLIRPDVDNFEFQQQQISQELQLSSRALDGRIDYIVGAYALKESSKDEVAEGVLTDIQAEDIVVPASQLPLPADQLAGLIRGAEIQFTNRVDNLAYSVFAQGTYAITDRLSFTGGLRASSERRRLFRRGVSQTAGNDLAGMMVAAGVQTNFFERSDRFTDITPSASLSYKFREGLLAYASYSTGFKSGGFNGRSFRPIGVEEAALPIEFDPEDLTTYEIGFKGAFLDQRLVVNAAAFYSIYEDVQLTVLSEDPDVALQNVTINLLNAGESIITGGELELVLNPIPNLLLRSSVGILHDRFTEVDDPSDPRAKDRHLAFVSPYTTSTSVEYSFDLFSLGNLTARADWSTRSQQFFDSPNSEGLKSGKRGLLDARLSLQLADGVTEVAVFGKNLTDREYLVSGVDFSASFGNQIRFVGPPRTYGIELRRRF